MSGTYHADQATGLLLSIPYDKGWKVTVDGTAVELSPAYGGSMSLIEVSAGEHEIEMTYRSPGLSIGMIVSLASTIALIQAMWITTRNTKCGRAKSAEG